MEVRFKCDYDKFRSSFNYCGHGAKDSDCSYPRIMKSNLNHLRRLGINILSLNFVWFCHKN